MLNTYITPRLGKIVVGHITADVLNEYCNWLLANGGQKKQGLSHKTVSDALSVIRSILHYARLQRIPVSCTGTEISIHTTRQKLCILSNSQQEQLVNYLVTNPSERNFGLLLCLYTGIRLGEVCALRWEDISEHEKTIHIHQTMQRVQLVNGDSEKKTAVITTTPKSPCSIRLIPVPPILWSLLSKFHTERGFILTGTEKYVEPRTMENHFKRVLKCVGLSNVNFHCLRHTFATRCVEVGFDVKTLSEILGHSNITITMNRYVHPTMQMKRENMERLSSLFLVN